LKNAELKLGAFNVIVGPNGSGKSSVLQALKALAELS
jgi:AAA15 family ATPase/GTPase